MALQNQDDFTVIDETDDFLVVDKPAGLLVHPTRPDGRRTLWDGLRDLLGYEIVTGGQVSLINRLDRETSGIVLVAKSSAAARDAGIAMIRREIAKEYQSLVFGWPEWEEALCEQPIIRRGEVMSSPVWLERCVHATGADAFTKFQVLSRGERADGVRWSLLHAQPLTGRTHQIRVHAAFLGHPVIGDKIYARGSDHYLAFIEHGWTRAMERELWLPRHALHCSSMALGPHTWRSPLPPDMASFR